MEVILLQKVANLGNIGDKVKVKPGYGRNYLLPQGKAVVATAANLKKGSLLTLLALLIPALAFLLRSHEPAQKEPTSAYLQPSGFVLLLITIGTLLILGPEYFYLRDNFGYRINTVFKFYYQAWILLSIAAAFTVAVLLAELRGAASILYTGLIFIVIAMALFYPIFSIPSKTDGFKASAPEQRTLDGSSYLAGFLPEDYQAFAFMKSLEPGVVAEAVGGQCCSPNRARSRSCQKVESLCPYMDNDYFDFAMSIPLEIRIPRSLRMDILKAHYPNVADIPTAPHMK